MVRKSYVEEIAAGLIVKSRSSLNPTVGDPRIALVPVNCRDIQQTCPDVVPLADRKSDRITHQVVKRGLKRGFACQRLP